MTIFDEILSRINIEEEFQRHGLRLNKLHGDEWECACPFCGDEKHLGMNRRTGLWRCVKCDKSGNLSTFIAETKGIKASEVWKELADLAGVEWKPEKQDKKNGKKGNKAEVEDKGSGAKKEAKKKEEPPAPAPALINTAPYQRLIELTTLTDAHRQELKTKRGFTDELIGRMRFRSGGTQTEEACSSLRDEFTPEELAASGLYVDINGKLQVNNQLTNDRVIIPYLDENGQVYHLRPHKLGFKGLPNHPYCRLFLADNPEHIVLTEGEFKAAALYQWGIPALAVPGVSSFGSKNFDRLVDLLREHKVKAVTVIFDNEIKDNPAYPNFKEKAEDRYDTQVWSYLMGIKLNKSGFVARIGWLPDEWRVNGKIDFDGALAQGRTKQDIERVIAGAMTPAEFIDSLPEEARRVVRRKVTRHLTKLPVKREFNKYVVTRYAKGEEFEETISNFIINIKSSFFTPDGVIRNVELVNEYGETSAVFSLEPGSMAGVNEFKKFVLSKGNYVFEGSAADLTNIWKAEFLRDSGEFIYMPDRIGRISRDLWLFGNLAIKGGKVYKPDDDGIIWIDGKGYKPQSLQVGPRGEAIEDAIPSLWTEPVDIKDIAAKIRQTIGGYEAYIGIGWVVATIFSEDIFRQYKYLPILFPHGKRESGKSTYMQWIMSFFGIETNGVGLAETSQNYIARSLSYYGSLGVWFDEYRNEPRVTQKDGFFRSAYNRQLSGKGTATAFQARGFAVNSTVAISGEELPKDSGLFTRLVPVQISAYRRDRTWFDWINKNLDKFSGFVYWLILNYDRLRDKILENIAELKKALLAMEINDRTAGNWAICAGAFETAVTQDDDFITWVGETCKTIKLTGEQEHILNQFWDDISVLWSQGELGQKYMKVDGDKLYLWFVGVYDTWAVHFRKKNGREPFDRQSILKYIQEEPYFMEKDFPIWLGGSTKRCLVINLKVANDAIKEIAEMIKENQAPTM